jgi:hypothetical protein
LFPHALHQGGLCCVPAARWLRTLRLTGQDIQELQPDLFQLAALEVGCVAAVSLIPAARHSPGLVM